MENSQYQSVDQFASDMRLIYQNCLKYNPPTTDVHKMGQKFQELFEIK